MSHISYEAYLNCKSIPCLSATQIQLDILHFYLLSLATLIQRGVTLYGNRFFSKTWRRQQGALNSYLQIMVKFRVSKEE